MPISAKLKEALKSASGISYLFSLTHKLSVEKASISRLQFLEKEVQELKNKLQQETLNKPEEFDPNKVIFVCGLHRSGTSLFTKILQDHKNISGFEDTGVIEDEGQFLQTVYTPDSELGWPGAFGYNTKSHLTEEDAKPIEKKQRQLISQWSYYLNEKADYFIEKSPPNLLKTRYLQTLFPSAYFIIIKRHPVAVSMATKKWSKNSIVKLIDHWLTCYEIWENDKKSINRFHEIKYEEFVKQPHLVLKETLQKIGIECDDNSIKIMLENYNISEEPNKKYFMKWNKKSFSKCIAALKYKKRAKQLGYDV